MSLHIQMSEEAELELRKTALRNKLSSLAVALAFILFGGGALFFAVILIVQDTPPAFLAYVPPAENLPPSSAPTTAELTSKASSPSNDVSPSVIVSTGPAPVAMASVEIEAAAVDIGSGIEIGMGFGTGDLGVSLGEGGGGMGSGQAGGSALVGTFYDMKLTSSGAKSKLAPAAGSTIPDRTKMSEVYYNFLRSWNEAVLNKFYKSPTKLYASNFYLPHCNAKYGPIAYKCDLNKVKPAGWVAVYRGNVKAPKSGKFRFVGTGDDLLCVRFNRKTVLESGWCIPSLYEKEPGNCFSITTENERGKAYMKAIKEGKDKNHKDYAYYEMPAGWSLNNVGGLTCGTPFNVKEGQIYPIEIMISEGPGGAFAFFVLMEDMTDNPQTKLPAAQRRYDIFRTNFSLPNHNEIKKMLQDAGCLWAGQMNCPPYNEDSPIWVAVP